MIKLERDRARITGGLKGAHLRTKQFKLLQLKRDLGTLESKNFKSNWWKPAKPQLKVESHGKCAYCEADTAVVAHGDVEHYRPKTLYWWLAYCYDNYSYSCQICNQSFKSNKFPRGGSKMRSPTVRSNATDEKLKELAARLAVDPSRLDDPPTLASFTANALNEDPFLPDPYMVDPEPLFEWEADEDLKTVEVRYRDDPDGKRTEAINKALGLNRDELLRTRWLAFEQARIFRDVVAALGDNHPAAVSAKKGLRMMVAPEARYAGMVRYFVREVWKLDDVLPA